MKFTRTLLAAAMLAAFGTAFAGDAPKAPADHKECKDMEKGKDKCCGKECKADKKKADAKKQ